MSIDASISRTLTTLASAHESLALTTVFVANTFPYLLIAGFVLYLVHTGRLRTREHLSVIILAFLAAVIARFGVTSTLWHYIHRPRPFLTGTIHSLFEVDAPSFPSGHTTFLCAFATVVFMHNKRMGSLLFAGAALVGIARVASGVHYPSDILAGALVGIAVGYLTFLIFSRFVQHHR